MPLDFMAIDFETANFFRGSPCAVGLAHVRDGHVIDRSSFLIHQDYFDGFNMSIHGITPQDVEDAPTFIELWPEIEQRIGGLPIVAHNAAFDTGVIRDALEADGIPLPTLTYACTLVMSRRAYDLPSYRLPFVAEAAGVSFEPDQHHIAENDAEVAALIMLDIARLHDAASLDDLARGLGIRLGQITSDGWHGCNSRNRSSRLGYGLSASEIDINQNADPDNPFYALGITFTGALGSMTRALAWQRVAEFGGAPLANVTAHTNLLVFGHQDAHKLAPGSALSSKFQKAVSLKEKGQEIEIIGEDDFLAMLQEAGLKTTPSGD